jgi:hypothetical protein
MIEENFAFAMGNREKFQFAGEFQTSENAEPS